MRYLKAVLLFAICLSLTAQSEEIKAAERTNVLFIIVDALNDMPLHPAGKPLVPTPNFDRLAKQGVSFTNAH